MQFHHKIIEPVGPVIGLCSTKTNNLTWDAQLPDSVMSHTVAAHFHFLQQWLTPGELAFVFVYLLWERRGWEIAPRRSGRRQTGLRWGHCPRARRRAGRRPPPLLSPPHPGRKSKAATEERGAAAAAGSVQQRAWREGEQAQRHTGPRETSSGGGERGPAVFVLITKASSLSRFLVMLVRTYGGKTPRRKDELVLRLGVCGRRSLMMEWCVTQWTKINK